LFPGADFEQNAELRCAPTGALLFCDSFTLKEPGSRCGDFRRFRSTVTLRLGDDRPVAIDRVDIGGLGPRSDGFTAFATMILAAGGRLETGSALVAALNQDLASVHNLYAAASSLPGGATGIWIRLAGRDLRAVRSGIAAAWSSIRRALFGEAPPTRRKDET
jgi:urease accessory protein UreH